MNDKQLIKFSKDFTKSILEINDGKSQNMCFAVCSPLSSLISMFGITNELTECEIHIDSEIYVHVYLLLKDGRILDPTADQFNDLLNTEMPLIYLGEKPKYYLPFQVNINN